MQKPTAIPYKWIPYKCWDRGRNVQGIVAGIIHQTCAVCGGVHGKYMVKWPATAKRKSYKTYICGRAIEFDNNSTIHIL